MPERPKGTVLFRLMLVNIFNNELYSNLIRHSAVGWQSLVERAGLEIRCPLIRDRGFKSHPYRTGAEKPLCPNGYRRFESSSRRLFFLSCYHVLIHDNSFALFVFTCAHVNTLRILRVGRCFLEFFSYSQKAYCGVADEIERKIWKIYKRSYGG